MSSFLLIDSVIHLLPFSLFNPRIDLSMQNLINHPSASSTTINNSQFISNDLATVDIVKNFVAVMKITKDMMQIKNTNQIVSALKKTPPLECIKN
jgi:hypothetical protein